MTPPQTYELTTFSTLVLMTLAAVVLYICVKILLSLAQWFIDSTSNSSSKEESVVEESESEVEEEEDDNTVEPPDLDTKKGN